jgi:hypothetical protein
MLYGHARAARAAPPFVEPDSFQGFQAALFGADVIMAIKQLDESIAMCPRQHGRINPTVFVDAMAGRQSRGDQWAGFSQYALDKLSTGTTFELEAIRLTDDAFSFFERDGAGAYVGSRDVFYPAVAA